MEKTIKKIYIINQTKNIFYHFTRLDQKPGVASFSLSHISNQYKLEGMYGEIPLSEFAIIPGMEYTIRHSSYGDAAYYDIQIRAGSSGIIDFSSRTTCE